MLRYWARDLCRSWSKRIAALFIVLSMLLSDLVTFAEPNPSATDSQTLICGYTEHQHTDACYEDVLVCGLEETEASRTYKTTFSPHTHSEACYDKDGNLACGIIENEYYHKHNDYCKDADGNLICGLKFKKPHEHTEECFDADGNLICTTEIITHKHSAACYDDNGHLACGQWEIPSFTSTADNLVETPGHHHDASCYEHRLTCGQEEHVHGPDCYATAENTESSENTNTADEATAEQPAEQANTSETIEQTEETEKDTAEQQIQTDNQPDNTDTNTTVDATNDDTLETIDTGTDPTAESVKESTEETNNTSSILENTEPEENHVGDKNVEENSVEEKPVEEKPIFETNGDVLTRYNGDETTVTIPDGIRKIDKKAFYNNKTITIVILPDSVEVINSSAFAECSNLEKVILGDQCKLELIGPAAFKNDTKLDISFAANVDRIVENAFAGNTQEETTEEEKTGEEEQTNTEEQNNTEEETKTEEQTNEEEQTGEENEQAEPEKSKEAEKSENTDNTEKTEESDKQENQEEPEYPDEISIPVAMTIPSDKDAPYQVIVTIPADAGIPEGTELVVAEQAEPQMRLMKSTPKSTTPMKLLGGKSLTVQEQPAEEETYASIPSLTEWKEGTEAPDIILYKKTLDISLVTADGEEIEPNTEAKITVSVNLPEIEDGQEVEVRHITDNGSELLESTNDAGTITFTTNSFSLFEFTSKAKELSTWTSGLLESIFFGITNTQETNHSEIAVSDVTEGLTVLEAFTVTKSSELWMTLQRIRDLALGELESITLYSVVDGKLGSIMKETITLSDVLRFSLSDLSSFALVKDSGLRHKNLEVILGDPSTDAENPETGCVILDGMMPKTATADAADVTNEYSGENDYSETQTEEEEETETPRILAAYDISILNNGEDYQPAEGQPISVEIRDERIPADRNIELWHIKDDGTKEQITGFTAEMGRIVFDASGFSVYIVIDHEDETVVTPRVKFHFIDDNPDSVTAGGMTTYYIGNPYTFVNKAKESQTSQILKDGESLELITDPGNRGEKYFYGWYIVNPYPIEGVTDAYGIGTDNSKLYYTWPAAPQSITFESPISIPKSNVNIGDDVSWSINGVSGTGRVDSDGNVHVLLAPVFEKYNFANFMLYPRESGGMASKTLMTRKMIALGSSSVVEVKISDIQSASVDPVHRIFTGWEYQETGGNESEWIYKQTVDYTGAEMHDPGKDGVYLSVDLADTTSVDLYPKFVQARWVDFFSGVSGSGATYVASRFREAWGIDPRHQTEGMEENISGEKNVFMSLPVPERAGYKFGGWYAFAATDPQTGEIRNLEDPASVTFSYLDHDYHSHTYTDNMTAVPITDGSGAVIFSSEQTVTDDEQTYYLFTGNSYDGRQALKLYDGLDRLTLYANWLPIDTDITIVYWTENAEDSQYTASATKTISTAALSAKLDNPIKSGSILTLDTLMAYDEAIKTAEGEDSVNFLVNPMALDDVGAVPQKTDPDSLVAREEIFYDRNDTLTRAENIYLVPDAQGNNTIVEGKVIDGQGTTSFNVYFSRKIFKLVFHIGRDGYCKAGGQQKADGDNWLEYMYTDTKVPEVLGRASKGSATASYLGEGQMTYNGKTYTSNYVTNADNIKFDYIPDLSNENDQNLYIITAKYGERIAERWPSPVNNAFEFNQIFAANKWRTPYIWTASYPSLYHVISFNRDTPGNAQGANADVNGVHEYMSAELCANRTGNGLINENQVHHLVAWFGEATNQNRFKMYHYLYEKVDGVTLPENAEIHQGTEYLTKLQTTWSAANTNGHGIGVILDNTYYEDPDESPVPVVSNLEPQFQMVTEKAGYQLVYSCYEGQKRSDDNSYHVFFFYKPKEYKLTFKFESGQVEESYLYKQSLAKAVKAAPEKEGYTFVGWYTNEAGQGDPFDFATAIMPAEGVVLYPVYKVLQYKVKIDPNGGVIDHINYNYSDKYGNKANNFGVEGTGYNTSQATYFTANYGTTVGEYTIKREYIRLTEKEQDPNNDSLYVPVSERYYYINTQLDGIYDGDWGLPPNLRNAVYMKEDQLRAYYNFYHRVATDYLEDYTNVHVFPTFDAFAAVYTSYPNTPYRRLKEAEHYSFMGWYQVKDGKLASMPYDFNEPVLADIELRALWRLDGGYYLTYDPVFVVDDGQGNKIYVSGVITQWTDPKEPSRQLYADQAPTHILHAPENVRDGWVFRGWRVVKNVGQATAIIDGTEQTYNIWEPIQLDNQGNAIYYQPGNNFIVDSKYVSETTPLGSVICMQAYYEPTEQSVRRPKVTNLTLDATDGYITFDETTELSADKNLDQLGENGTVLLDADKDQIVFGDIQSNIAVHLVDYAVSSNYDDQYEARTHNYFKHPRGYFLLGFDRAPDDDFIAEFPADGVIAVPRIDEETDGETLYAVWEKMVYVNFINTTNEEIKIDLTGTGYSTVSIVNVATGLFDRKRTTSRIIVPARANGVDGRVKIVLPGANPGVDSFTATAINDHLRKKMSVTGEFPAGTDYPNLTPSTDIRYGGSVIYNQVLREDPNGEGIFVTYTEEPVEEVVYNVNGGTWTQPLAPDTGYVHQMGDVYALPKEAIVADPSRSYEPTEPTREGMIFVGWTDNADIAAATDFHSETPEIFGSTTITPDEGSTVLEKIKKEKLWDFNSDPPYDRTLYAVWSETATVTFNLIRSGNNRHNWTGPSTTSTPAEHVFYRANGSSNTVTYTLMKGEKVPCPQDPTCGSNLARTFMAWVTVANYIDAVNQWTTISRFAFDFDQPVNNDIIIYTSWRDNKNYQVYTFTVNNIVEDALDANEEFTYIISAEDVHLRIANNDPGSAESFTPLRTKLKNGEQYTIKITTIRETSNDKHNYTGYDVYAEVIDRAGQTVGTGHLLNYLDTENNLINEGREYTYTIRVAQEPLTGYSTNVYTDETGEPILTLLHDQFTFHSSNRNSAPYKPIENTFVEKGNTSAAVTFVNRRATYLTLTKNILTDLGDWERDFTFTLESVGAEGEEREGTEYAYTKTKNSISIGSGWLTTAAERNTFTLQKGESIAIDVPRGRAIVISENNTNYATTWSNDSSSTLSMVFDDNNDSKATFTLNGDATATIINTRLTKTITVKKVVEPEATTVSFSFTAKLLNNDTPIAGYTVYSDNNTILTTDANGQVSFSLFHNGTQTLNIPNDLKLIVTENNAAAYNPDPVMLDGNNNPIPDADNNLNSFTINNVTTEGTITFTNRRKVDLTLTKLVQYNVGDWDSDFTFTLNSVEGEISGTTYPYTKTTGNSNTTDLLTTGDSFTLKHNESITIALPLNKAVVIEEDNRNYTTVWSTTGTAVSITNPNAAEATLTLTDDASVTVTNTQETREVTVQKIVDPVDTSVSFTFTAEIQKNDIFVEGYPVYTDENNNINDLSTNSNGQVKFNLSHNETKVLTIPYGAKLVVTETVPIDCTPDATMVDNDDNPIADDDSVLGSFTLNCIETDGTITFKNTKVERVLFDVNGGEWDNRPASYEHLLEDKYGITKENIEANGGVYEPSTAPTRSGKIFIGWTTNEALAEEMDFSGEDARTFGTGDSALTLTPGTGEIMLDRVRSEGLWDFNQEPPYGKTLYAVWSDAVTVTYNIAYTQNLEAATVEPHQWVGPDLESTETQYKYCNLDSKGRYITYTMAKGERTPTPSNPIPVNNNTARTWNFVRWLNKTLYSDADQYRYIQQSPSEINLTTYAFDFTQRIYADKELVTSWTKNAPQVFTFTVLNNVIGGNVNDEFDYTIAVTDELVLGKTGKTKPNSNVVSTPDRTWGSITTSLKNNQQYTILITVSYITNWGGANSVQIDVIDRDGIVIKSGHVIYCNWNTYNNFVSDYKYTLTITQNEETGFVTTVREENENPANSIESDPSDQNRSFTFTSIENRTSSDSRFSSEQNQYCTGRLKKINNTNTDDPQGIRAGNYSLNVVFTNKMPICKIATVSTVEDVETYNEHTFYSLNAAIDYITSASAGTVYATPGSNDYTTGTGTNPVIEMLVDYPMPSTDTVTIPAGSNVTITTASREYGTYRFRDSGTISTIRRGFDGGSMFTVGAGATLTLDNITLNGNKGIYPSSAQGGLVNAAAANGSVTMYAGATLTSSKTTEEGGAVYLASGSTFTMNGGTISNCEAVNGGAVYETGATVTFTSASVVTGNTATSEGAAVYANGGTVNIGGTTQISNNSASSTIGGAINTSSGTTINFSGNPIVHNNPSSTATQQKNVVLSEDSNTIINVTGTLGSDAQIGIYDASGNVDTEGGHNRAGEPFGTRITGVTGDFSKFVNDRNGLHGMQSGDDPDMLVIWEAVILSVSKTVTGGTGEQTQDFTFTLTVASKDTAPTSYTILKTKQSGTTETLSISSGETFTLKDGETASIKWLPKDVNITVAETTVDGYTTTNSLAIGNATVDVSGVSRTFTLDGNGVLAFTNVLQSQEETIVAPTGFSIRHTPFLLLLLFGLMLLIGGGVVVKRRRGADPDDGGTVAVNTIPTNTGPPGGATFTATMTEPRKPVDTPQPTYSTTDAESHIRWRNSVWVVERANGSYRGYVPPAPQARRNVSCPQTKLWMTDSNCQTGKRGDAG